MSDDRRRGSGRPGQARSGQQSRSGQSGRSGSSQGRSGRPEQTGRGRPRTQGGKPAGAGSKGGRPARKGDWKRPAEKQEPRTAEQAKYDGPPIPDHITGRELDRSVAAQLKGLPDRLALRVARHLAAAQELIEEDPETAYQHTLAARARAGRLAVVREATGEAAYAAGHYAEALADLRAAKRMNGATAYLPMMADSHRALGKPEQALKLARSEGVKNFDSPARAEMTLVESGARRDMGQLDAALRVLEQAPLMSSSREPWVVRLRYAYADTLLAAGREEEALAWFHRTHAIDGTEITDAAERAEELERGRE
ncbi:tetratricopeptide repeat protein [Nocardioides rotundus]|uniref:tetratricopeptide repeat protein n=1 Tax=Nocardioides rotundus TaxID=1774216 RepID=UPI001CBDBD13|nr:tetratricopeptide repeat protein [Nocardioides rotundus]